MEPFASDVTEYLRSLAAVGSYRPHSSVCDRSRGSSEEISPPNNDFRSFLVVCCSVGRGAGRVDQSDKVRLPFHAPECDNGVFEPKIDSFALSPNVNSCFLPLKWRLKKQKPFWRFPFRLGLFFRLPLLIEHFTLWLY